MIAEIFLICSVNLQALPHSDVIEPSVLNEIDHALNRAPENAAYIPQVMVGDALKYLGVSNGMSNTETAIRIVSSQNRDGRWISKKGLDISLAAIETLKTLSGDRTLVSKKYIPSIDIEDFSKKHELSFSESAARFRKMGFRKIELSYPVEDEKISCLKALSFKIPVIVWVRTGREFPRMECFYDALRTAEKAHSKELYIILGPSVEIGLREQSLISGVSNAAQKSGIKLVVAEFSGVLYDR